MTAIETLYHHTFSPWTADGDRRVVAPESEWRNVLAWDREAKEKGERIRVKVGVDVFEEDTNDESCNRLFGTLALLTHTDCFVLTSHLNRTADYISAKGSPSCSHPHTNSRGILVSAWAARIARQSSRFEELADNAPFIDDSYPGVVAWPLSHVFLGTRVSTQAEADTHIPALLRVPASMRWLEVVPMEKIDLRLDPDPRVEVSRRILGGSGWRPDLTTQNEIERWQSERIGFLVIAGEVGPNARPTNLAHVRSLVSQCKDAGVACWVERLGSKIVVDTASLGLFRSMPWMGGMSEFRTSDPDGADIAEFPPDFQVRQLPGRVTR